MKKILSLIALLGLMCSCSPYSLVNSETYNNADLARYHTFRIVTPDMGKLPLGMEMVTYYNIAAAIREEMLMRGFTESAESPLLVNIAVTTQREIATEPLMPPGGYFPYNGPYYPYYMWPRYNYGRTGIPHTTAMPRLSPVYIRKAYSPWTLSTSTPSFRSSPHPWQPFSTEAATAIRISRESTKPSRPSSLASPYLCCRSTVKTDL